MPTTNLKNNLNLIGGKFTEDGQPLGRESTIFVTDPAQFENIDSSKNYMVDGELDMGSRSIVVPEGGISISGLNGARDTTILKSSEDNYSLFVSPAGGYSGNVVMESMTVTVDGSGSQVFDLDNDGNSSALDIVGVNFTNCTSLGNLADYRQLFMENMGFLFIDDGLTFNGTWTGIALINSVAVSFPAATLLNQGTGFTIGGSIRSNMNFLSVNAASVFCDFTEASILTDAAFALDGFRTVATNAVPNVPSSSVKALFANCRGVSDTYPGGSMVIDANATTTISAQDTLTLAAGNGTASELAWFQKSGSANLQSISSEEIRVKVSARYTFSGSSNDQVQVQLRQWDNSASSYMDIGAAKTGTMNGGLLGTRAENIALSAYATINENDRIEVWIANTTAARDISVIEGSDFLVSER